MSRIIECNTEHRLTYLQDGYKSIPRGLLCPVHAVIAGRSLSRWGELKIKLSRGSLSKDADSALYNFTSWFQASLFEEIDFRPTQWHQISSYLGIHPIGHSHEHICSTDRHFCSSVLQNPVVLRFVLTEETSSPQQGRR